MIDRDYKKFDADFIFSKPHGTNELCIIMPVYNEYTYLFKHLEVLSQQIFQDFDLIVILSNLDTSAVVDELKKKELKYGLVVIKRKDDTGSSGGFYAGERYALAKGYKHLIMADVDCFPVDNDVIEKMMAAKEAGWVAPILLMREGEHTMRDDILHCYNLLDINIFRKVGLHYPSIYIGGDDYEMELRIKRHGFRRKLVDVKCEHPLKKYNSFESGTDILYPMNTTLFGCGFFGNSARIALKLVSMMYSSLEWERMWAIGVLKDSFYGLKGRELFAKHKYDVNKYGTEEKEAMEPGMKLKKQDIDVVDKQNTVQAGRKVRFLFQQFQMAARKSGEDILIGNIGATIPITFLKLFAKRCYYKTSKNRYVLLSENKSGFSKAGKVLVSPFMLMFVVLMIEGMKFRGREIVASLDGYGLSLD